MVKESKLDDFMKPKKVKCCHQLLKDERMLCGLFYDENDEQPLEKPCNSPENPECCLMCNVNQRGIDYFFNNPELKEKHIREME